MIQEVSHAEIVRRFGAVFRQEHLPIKPTNGCLWYASHEACGALQPVSTTVVRIKGTVTLPEYRGQGYGERILHHLLAVAQTRWTTVEIYAKHPNWFIKNGWTVIRTTRWGVTVLRTSLPPV